jgi:hypothetical protein
MVDNYEAPRRMIGAPLGSALRARRARSSSPLIAMLIFTSAKKCLCGKHFRNAFASSS